MNGRVTLTVPLARFNLFQELITRGEENCKAYATITLSLGFRPFHFSVLLFLLIHFQKLRSNLRMCHEQSLCYLQRAFLLTHVFYF